MSASDRSVRGAARDGEPHVDAAGLLPELAAAHGSDGVYTPAPSATLALAMVHRPLAEKCM
jgi:hypothetical protein